VKYDSVLDANSAKYHVRSIRDSDNVFAVNYVNAWNFSLPSETPHASVWSFSAKLGYHFSTGGHLRLALVRSDKDPRVVCKFWSEAFDVRFAKICFSMNCFIDLPLLSNSSTPTLIASLEEPTFKMNTILLDC